MTIDYDQLAAATARRAAAEQQAQQELADRRTAIDAALTTYLGASRNRLGITISPDGYSASFGHASGDYRLIPSKQGFLLQNTRKGGMQYSVSTDLQLLDWLEQFGGQGAAVAQPAAPVEQPAQQPEQPTTLEKPFRFQSSNDVSW